MEAAMRIMSTDGAMAIRPERKDLNSPFTPMPAASTATTPATRNMIATMIMVKSRRTGMNPEEMTTAMPVPRIRANRSRPRSMRLSGTWSPAAALAPFSGRRLAWKRTNRRSRA